MTEFSFDFDDSACLEALEQAEAAHQIFSSLQGQTSFTPPTYSNIPTQHRYGARFTATNETSKGSIITPPPIVTSNSNVVQPPIQTSSQVPINTHNFNSNATYSPPVPKFSTGDACLKNPETSNQFGSLSLQQTQQARTVCIHISYGGYQRIKITFIGETVTIHPFQQQRKPAWFYSKSKNQHKPPPPPKVYFTRSILPKAILEQLQSVDNRHAERYWDLEMKHDLACRKWAAEPWPYYEECIEEGHLCGIWYYPVRTLELLEKTLSNFASQEKNRQSRNPDFYQRVDVVCQIMPQYVKGLIQDANKIYKRALEAQLGQRSTYEMSVEDLLNCSTTVTLSSQSQHQSVIIPESLLKTKLFRQLKPYQLKGVEFGIARDGRFLLADAPGLGKTIQAIALASFYQSDWPILVICPSSVRMMWANEFQKWFPDLLGPSDISVNFSGKKTDLKCMVNIISYELLKNKKTLEKVYGLPSSEPSPSSNTSKPISSYEAPPTPTVPYNPWETVKFASKNPQSEGSGPNTNSTSSNPFADAPSPFGVVICDECHLLKTYNSARSEAIVPIVKKAKRAIMLSGTPATSRPSELHSQLSSILPNVFKYFPNYGDRYCDGKDSQFGKDYSGASNLKELNYLLQEMLMIRRRKSEVLTDMTQKRRHQLQLDIPKKAMKLLLKLARELVDPLKRKGKKDSAEGEFAAINSPFGKSNQDALSERSKRRSIVFELFQNVGRAKIPSAVAHLKSCLLADHDTKYLIFAHHLDVLNGLAHGISELGIDYIRIDGATPASSRQHLVDHFQKNPSCRVGVLSIGAAGVGITLTKATTVFFAEMAWSPGLLLQAEDRAHRIGQEKDVDVYYMIAKNTYDERLWQVLETKLSVLNSTLDGSEQNDQSLKFDSTVVHKGAMISGTNTVDQANGENDEDDFISYILQKIEGYSERLEEFESRMNIRRKVKEGKGVLEDFVQPNTRGYGSLDDEGEDLDWKLHADALADDGILDAATSINSPISNSSLLQDHRDLSTNQKKRPRAVKKTATNSDGSSASLTKAKKSTGKKSSTNSQFAEYEVLEYLESVEEITSPNKKPKTGEEFSDHFLDNILDYQPPSSFNTSYVQKPAEMEIEQSTSPLLIPALQSVSATSNESIQRSRAAKFRMFSMDS